MSSAIASPSLDFPDGFIAWSTLVNLMASIWEDVAKRPYITVGFIAFVSMVPLALTSTAGWIRRLGGRNWQRLHRLIYLTGIAGVTHYWWRVKADTLHPIIYAAIVVLLLGLPPGFLVQAIAIAAHYRSSPRLDTNADGRSQLQPSGRCFSCVQVWTTLEVNILKQAFFHRAVQELGQAEAGYNQAAAGAR